MKIFDLALSLVFFLFFTNLSPLYAQGGAAPAATNGPTGLLVAYPSDE